MGNKITGNIAAECGTGVKRIMIFQKINDDNVVNKGEGLEILYSVTPYLSTTHSITGDGTYKRGGINLGNINIWIGHQCVLPDLHEAHTKQLSGDLIIKKFALDLVNGEYKYTLIDTETYYEARILFMCSIFSANVMTAWGRSHNFLTNIKFSANQMINKIIDDDGKGNKTTTSIGIDLEEGSVSIS